MNADTEQHVIIRGGVENTRLEDKNTKKSKAKDRLSEDRPSRGQGQKCSRPRTKDTVCKCSKKTKIFAQKIANFSRNFRRRKKKHDLGPFLTNQKIMLSSAEDRAFSRTWRLRGQGFHNVFSRPRTSSRTPPLKII